MVGAKKSRKEDRSRSPEWETRRQRRRGGKTDVKGVEDEEEGPRQPTKATQYAPIEFGKGVGRQKSFHEMVAQRDVVHNRGCEGKVSAAVEAYEKNLGQQAPQTPVWPKSEKEEKALSDYDDEGMYGNLFDVDEEAAEQVLRSAGSEAFCG